MSKYRLTRGATIYLNTPTKVAVYSGEISADESIRVAIKEQQHASIESANRAIQEAMAMTALNHPHIVKIYDIWLETGDRTEFKSVLVMELMERDLEKEMQQRKGEGRPWTDVELVRMLRDLVSALSKAQQHGISHRDIKPQNLLVTGNTVKVGDFGSSTRQLEISRIRETLQGSPFFLSPELKQEYANVLLRGTHSLSYDPIKSDVYSLGVTFLQLAAMQPPMELTNLPNLEAETGKLIGKLGNYPNLKVVLEQMLGAGADSRPTFVDIEEYFEGNKGYFDWLWSGEVIEEDCCEDYEAGQAEGPRIDVEIPDFVQKSVERPAPEHGKRAEFAEKAANPDASAANPAPIAYPDLHYEAKYAPPLPPEEQPPQPQPPALDLTCSKCGQLVPYDGENTLCKGCRLVSCIVCSALCSNPIADKYITDDLLVVIDSAGRCCSVTCLRILRDRELSPSLCISCFDPLPEAPRLQLECGHYCHDTHCLFEFMARGSDNSQQESPTYKCPTCEGTLRHVDLLNHFKPNEFKWMKKAPFCQNCGASLSKFRESNMGRYCYHCQSRNSS